MAAVICVISLLQLPLATGVPLTFQVFAVALSGYVLGSLRGTGAVFIYAAIGLVGVPVFSGVVGGFSVLFGPTGGFLAGFFLISLFAGLGKDKKPLWSILLGILGLALCHFLGVVHYVNVMKSGIVTALLTVSLPYILKDAALVAGAYFLSLPIKHSVTKR